MTIEERCKYLIDKGYTYNPENGEVISHLNKLIRKKTLGYITLSLKVNNKKFYVKAHQFAWYWVYKEIPSLIDHIDRNRTNNKIDNLRDTNIQLNNYNCLGRGYHFNKRINKFQSFIGVDSKLIYLGTYKTKEESREAYLKAKEKYHKIN